MAQLIGTTAPPKRGSATARPSTAPSTEIAGVMMPSPYSRAAPITANSATAEIRPGLAPRICSGTSASSAKMPPSPLFSAFMMKVRYFMVTTSISAQKISDRMP